MGIYGTVDITREEAIKVIYSRLHIATDEEFSDVLFALVREVPDRLPHNFSIVKVGGATAEYVLGLDNEEGITDF